MTAGRGGFVPEVSVPRWFVPAVVLALSAFLLSAGTLLYMLSGGGGHEPFRVLQPDPLAAGLAVPDFTLVDQEGKSQTQALLDGRVTIIDFIFTHCPFACPGMTMAMSELQQQLAGTPVRFASFSVDPERDTPERLRKFASDHDADPARWTFLTGDRATVDRIVHDSLQFALQEDPDRKIDLPEGGQMSNITHPTKLVLVGPDRRVLGFYDPNRQEDMDKLLVRAKLAAQSAASWTGGTR